MSPQRATLVISSRRTALLAAVALVLATPLPAPALAQRCGRSASRRPRRLTFSRRPGPSHVQLPSGVQTVALPPDADPAYSTPVDLDGDVDFGRTTRRVVRDPTGEAPGTLTINTRLRKLYLSLGDGAGDGIRHRRRPTGLRLEGRGRDRPEGLLAGMDAPAGNAGAQSRTAAPSRRRPRQSARARARSISSRTTRTRCFASTAPTSRSRSATPCRRAASACSTPT